MWKIFITIDDGNTSYLFVQNYNAVLIPPDQIQNTVPSEIIHLLNGDSEFKRLGLNAYQTAYRQLKSWHDRMQAETAVIWHLLEDKSIR